MNLLDLRIPNGRTSFLFWLLSESHFELTKANKNYLPLSKTKFQTFFIFSDISFHTVFKTPRHILWNWSRFARCPRTTINEIHNNHIKINCLRRGSFLGNKSYFLYSEKEFFQNSKTKRIYQLATWNFRNSAKNIQNLEFGRFSIVINSFPHLQCY